MIKKVIITLAIGLGVLASAYADGGHKGNGDHDVRGKASSTNIKTR